MATRDRFSPDHILPIFLSERTEEPARSGTNKIAVLAAIAFVFMVAAVGLAIISAGGWPSNAKASQVSASTQDIAGKSEPTIQSPVAVATLPPTVKDAPTGDELIFAFKLAFEGRAEVDRQPAEALINRFQAWAAHEDAQAQIRPPQPVRDARAQVVQKVQTPLPKPEAIRSEKAAAIQRSTPQNSQWLKQGFDWRN